MGAQFGVVFATVCGVVQGSILGPLLLYFRFERENILSPPLVLHETPTREKGHDNREESSSWKQVFV